MLAGYVDYNTVSNSTVHRLRVTSQGIVYSGNVPAYNTVVDKDADNLPSDTLWDNYGFLRINNPDTTHKELPTRLTQLDDTPASYAGEANKVLAVTPGEDGIEFITLPSGVTIFTGLSDTPNSFLAQAGKFLQVNLAEDALEFVDPPNNLGLSHAVVFTDVDGDFTGDITTTRGLRYLDNLNGHNALVVNGFEIRTLPNSDWAVAQFDELGYGSTVQFTDQQLNIFTHSNRAYWLQFQAHGGTDNTTADIAPFTGGTAGLISFRPNSVQAYGINANTAPDNASALNLTFGASWSAVDNATITLTHDNFVRFDKYGTGTMTAGAPAKLAAFDAVGTLVEIDLIGDSTFTSLSDTPTDYLGHMFKVVRVNAAEDALEFVDLPAGLQTFLELTDTPGTYTADYLVSVNSTGDGLVYTDPTTLQDGNGIISALPLGNTEVIGGANNLNIATTGVVTIGDYAGSGANNYIATSSLTSIISSDTVSIGDVSQNTHASILEIDTDGNINLDGLDVNIDASDDISLDALDRISLWATGDLRLNSDVEIIFATKTGNKPNVT